MFPLRITLVLIIFSAGLFAQTFNASVDNTTVGDNERFEIKFTFEGSSVNNLKNFSPPSFNNFKVLSGPNQSSSMQIINGAVSASLTLSYILYPTSQGSFTIGSASIELDGKNFRTDPLKITVVKGSDKPKGNSNQGLSNEEIAKNLFIRASIDKSRVYQGEQVTVTYKIYTRLNIASQMSVDKLPQYQGFWAEELNTGRAINFSTEVVDGKQFKVGVLKKVALFPSQTGNLEITPLELTVPLQLQRKRNPNNIWDDFFGDPFGRGDIIEYQAKSNIVKIDVTPLPESSKPASFKGAVGNYDFTAQLDKENLKTNEPVSLKLKISGTGNIKLLDFPDFELPNGFEKYEPKTNDEISRDNLINGYKEAEYLLVPRVAGVRDFNPIEFSYFDPAKKSYVTLKSKPLKLEIEQGQQASVTNIADQEMINKLGDDIRFIKTKYDDIAKQDKLLLLKPGFWAAVIFPLILSFGLIGWKRKQDKLAGNVSLLKYQRAEKIAKKRFKKAKTYLEQNQSSLFYSEISQALFGYLEDKLHLPKSEFVLDNALSKLDKKGIAPELVNRLKVNAEKCEFIRFAPSSNGNVEMQNMYKSLSDIVIEIERSLN